MAGRPAGKKENETAADQQEHNAGGDADLSIHVMGLAFFIVRQTRPFFLIRANPRAHT
jgi:hypothetical protein